MAAFPRPAGLASAQMCSTFGFRPVGRPCGFSSNSVLVATIDWRIEHAVLRGICAFRRQQQVTAAGSSRSPTLAPARRPRLRSDDARVPRHPSACPLAILKTLAAKIDIPAVGEPAHPVPSADGILCLRISEMFAVTPSSKRRGTARPQWRSHQPRSTRPAASLAYRRPPAHFFPFSGSAPSMCAA